MSEREPSTAEHRLELARELVDDIELSRIPAEQLLLKAARLARLTEETDVRVWLGFELIGCGNTEAGRKHMDKMGRWTDKARDRGHWMPFAAISGTIAAVQLQIQQLQVPDVQLSVSSANPHEFVTGFGSTTQRGLTGPGNAVLLRLSELTSSVTTLSSIRSRVLAHVHEFATRTYYNLAFSGVAESIFQRHQVAIDALLRDSAPEVIEKVPAISERLAAGGNEAISQAMNSCRRMIKAFADATYPPNDTPVTVDGQQYEIGTDKVLNRIQLHLRERCTSETRRDRLNQTLRRIHERASAATHGDVTVEEAKALFLHTYLVLGEILDATQAPPEATDAVEGAGA